MVIQTLRNISDGHCIYRQNVMLRGSATCLRSHSSKEAVKAGTIRLSDLSLICSLVLLLLRAGKALWCGAQGGGGTYIAQRVEDDIR
jgi:hypothetical protein